MEVQLLPESHMAILIDQNPTALKKESIQRYCRKCPLNHGCNKDPRGGKGWKDKSKKRHGR